MKQRAMISEEVQAGVDRIWERIVGRVESARVEELRVTRGTRRLSYHRINLGVCCPIWPLCSITYVGASWLIQAP